MSEAKKLEKAAAKAVKDAAKATEKAAKDAEKAAEKAAEDAENAVKKAEADLATEQFMAFISKAENPNIVLLRQKEVIQWLFGDLSFLPEIEKKNKRLDESEYKALEDNWGQAVMKIRRADLKLDKQWTNKFGEHICEEIYTLHGKVVTKPVKQKRYQPDSKVDDAILEAKAQTFYTSGTAGEKIMGVPVKYAEIPKLYGKPVKILCMGGAEKVCRENYGILPGAMCSPEKQEFLEFFRSRKFEFIGASDLLRSLSSSL
jgi:hypothetical protein